MTGLDDELAREMASWEAAGLRRELPKPVDGLADFVSNDYLSLAREPRVVEAAREALERDGAGGRAARLLGGGSPESAELEREVADWLGCERALLFPSGWQANQGLVAALAGPGDAILSDELVHASLVDGARLSRARVHVHAHGDLDELERMLVRSAGARRRLVLTEGVFSMDGDAAPLAALAELCERHDAWLVVDEAHAAGLLGEDGAGAWSAAGLPPRHPRLAARVVTGGKALGVCGALVCGSASLALHLVNRARAFVFTTAPSPATVGALRAAVRIARAEPERRERALAAAGSLAESIGLPAPAAAIVSDVIGEERAALEAAERLRAGGIDVRAVRPPTVPPGTARLRWVTHAHNDTAEVDEALRYLSGAVSHQNPPLTRRRSTAARAQAGKWRILVRHRTAQIPAPRFVVGTDTGIGKTVVSAALLLAARRRGPARYWKPVQTGDDDDTRTVLELADAPADCAPPPLVSLPLPASPHEAAAAAGTSIDPRTLDARLAELLAEPVPGPLLVELAGGLLVPYTGGPAAETQADWLARERPALVLVARSGLGTLNHTLLTLEALRARHLEPAGLILVGPPHASNRATLAELGHVAPVLELPHLDPLSTEALGRWVDANATALEALFP